MEKIKCACLIACKKFFRLRAKVKINASLRRLVTFQVGEEIVAGYLAYKRLPNLYFHCGKLGHLIRQCSLIAPGTDMRIVVVYGLWIKAPSERSWVEFSLEDGDNSGQDVEDCGGEGVARLDSQVVGEMPRDVLPKEEGAILVEFGGSIEKETVTEGDLDQSQLLGDATQNVEQNRERSWVEFSLEDGDNSGQDVEDCGGEGVARLDSQVVGEMPRDVLPKEEGAILVEFGGSIEKETVTEGDLDQSQLLGDATQNVEQNRGSCTM
ncbi:hypothetical protein LIER_30037 [Lithospermum erythrorhizon]|uniref:CCHC-type domain-containing protein n=1 Tax=Lithospermum erythrorhizon TaxID=34254 RepID=A0AAV3RRH0_LITER